MWTRMLSLRHGDGQSIAHTPESILELRDDAGVCHSLVRRLVQRKRERAEADLRGWGWAMLCLHRLEITSTSFLRWGTW